MTYREAYMKCETLEELKQIVNEDIAVAIILNKDRVSIIKKEAEEVANLKFKEVE